MKVIQTENGLIKAWTDGVQVEDNAWVQLTNISNLPFVYHHVAVMPDCHSGKGSCIGSVVATKGAICPSLVGVDIGCGMIAGMTNLHRDEISQGDTEDLFNVIGRAIPNGRTNNGQRGDRGAWGDVPEAVSNAYDLNLGDLEHDYAHPYAKNQLGTLGTGNHFVELSSDENGYVWVVIHSGSRGPGAKAGTGFIKQAKEDMERYYINLPDKDLAFIPEGTQAFSDYIRSVNWAQKYAKLNRELMFTAVRRSLVGVLNREVQVVDVLDCHHNYIAQEYHFGSNIWVTRKGAIRARLGDRGIIPGSMGAKSFIVKGKGNKDSFCSASHGAGRIMSRTEAKKTFTTEQHAKATEGVVCHKGTEILDETPGSYKDIDAVMAAQSDLVEVEHTLKQFMSLKGIGDGRR